MGTLCVSAPSSRNPKSSNRHFPKPFKGRAITVVTSGPLVDEVAETVVLPCSAEAVLYAGVCSTPLGKEVRC